MYTLDTNTIIYYLDDDNNVGKFLNKVLSEEVIIYTSSMTELELFSYPLITKEGAKKIDFEVD